MGGYDFTKEAKYVVDGGGDSREVYRKSDGGGVECFDDRALEVEQADLKQQLPVVHSSKSATDKIGFFQLFRFADSTDKLLMAVGVVCAIIHGVAIQVNFLLLAGVVDTFTANATGPSSQSTTFYSPSPFNFAVLLTESRSTGDEIRDIVISFCAIALVVLVVGYVHMVCWCTAAERQVCVIRARAFRSVIHQHMAWFDAHPTGELNTRLTSDIINIQSGIGDKVATFIQWTSTFLGGIVICMIKGWQLTLVMILVSPLAIVVGGIVASLMQRFTTLELNTYAKAGSVAEEVLSSIKTVSAYSGQPVEISRYDQKLTIAKKTGIKRGIVAGVGQGALWTIIFGIIAMAFWYGAKLIREQDYSIGVVLQVQFSLFTGTRALSQAISNLEAFSLARSAAVTVFRVIADVSEIDSSLPGGKKPHAYHANIQIRDVHFAYPGRKDIPVLKKMRINIEQGKTVALVGASGCGKSTIVQLLLRFYDPTSGNILLDGTDLSDLNVSWLRSQIGLVSQEPVLFATSIKENIRFGKENCTQEDIESAAKEANAHSFILKLPQGYDTSVGSRGGQMSGGQKQRIAIARALVRNPRILILDDATSALDYHSEAVVQQALDKARQGRTTLIIAHRLSTIRSADQICLIDDGNIVERGTHDELVALGGSYYRLVANQMKNEDEEVSESDEKEVIEKGQEDLSRRTSLKRRSTRRRSSRKNQIEAKEEEVVDDEEVETKMTTGVIKRLFKLNSPEAGLIVMGVIGAILQGSVFPLLAVFSSEILEAVLIDNVEEQKKEVNFYVMILALIGIAAGVCMFIMVAAFNASGERLTERMRSMAFRAMLRQEMGWFDDQRNQVGALTSRLASDASMVKAATGGTLSTVINASSTMILSLAVAYSFGWKLALVDSVFLPPLIAMGMLQTKMLVGFARGSKESVEEGGKIISEVMESIRTVVALGKEEYFIRCYNGHFEATSREGRKRAHIYGLTWGLSQSILFFAYAANFGFGGYLIDREEIEFKNVFRIFIAISTSSIEVGRINAFVSDYSRAKVSAAKLFALFDRPTEIDPELGTGLTPASCVGNVEFRDVKFRYPTRRQVQVLKGLRLSIEPGKTLALVGSSGCGKSTTVGLLERFYSPEAGEVFVDNHEVKALQLSWLRSHIGIVAQEPVLFETTIRANIAYGDHTRVIPLQEIIEASKAANIHDFIVTLPMGYDTMVGSSGAQLVGGQKQRIAIARALVRNPKILLLDEATSALDTENERVVQEALDVAQKGRTSIVIAHRLSTIENADKIAVFDQGVVVEQGTHSQLMERRGLYFALQEIQKGKS